MKRMCRKKFTGSFFQKSFRFQSVTEFTDYAGNEPVRKNRIKIPQFGEFHCGNNKKIPRKSGD